MLVALFPHVSQNAFTRANEITEEKTAIKQDLFFMQFLNGQLLILILLIVVLIKKRKLKNS